MLLAAHLAVLGFVGRAGRAVTGCVTHSRPDSEALGVFLNTLPFCSPAMDCTWDQFVAAVFEHEKELIAHRAYPLVAIKQLAGGELPFDTGFNFVHFHIYQGLIDLPGIHVNSAEAFEETDFPLLAQFIQHPDTDRLELVLIHDPRAVNEEQIVSFTRLYRKALRALATAGHEQVTRAFALDESERRSLIRGPAVEYTERDLGSWFEEVARERGGAVAVVCEAESVTYAELNRRANREARWLRERGVGPEVRVGLCRERSIGLVVGMLAIVKAGGAYVPMDPRYPAARLAYLAADSGVAVVLDEQAVETAAETVNPGIAVHPAQAAYVIYTSGSSGQPKGCVVTHANVSRLLEATRERFAFTGKDVWAMFHSPSFDFSVWEIWGALLNGARLVIVPYEVSRSPEAFWELLRREQVTVLNQTPSAFRQLVSLEQKEPLAQLRLIIFGGEALDPSSLERWMGKYGERTELVNMYGITETTVHVTEKRMRAGDLTGIGVPLADLSVYVLDGELEPVPVGVRGEICVGGAGVARGYLGRAALTAERFVPDPFGASGSRMYRSGDVARWRSAGELEYWGRGDEQLKIRGFRIEPGEIEEALRQCEGVRAAVVEVVEGRLAAWVVAERHEDLRAQLQARLPEYMVPAAIVPIAEIPLTVHGKIDRRALPEPGWTDGSVAFVAPASDTETKLAALYREVLGLERVGTRHNFFEMGGDSISATRLVSRIRVEFGNDFPLRTFFESSDILTLATRLSAITTPTTVPLRIKPATRQLVSASGSGGRA